MRRRDGLLLLAAAALAAPAGAQAAPPAEVGGEIAGARLQGQGRLRFLGLHVYDIRLWVGAQPVTPADWSVPLALELEYARTLYGKLIAERSIEEMRRQTPLARERAESWLAALTGLFPDVRAGDRITGVKRPGEGARFFLNGTFKGEVRDGDFARLFFGIWLAPQTSEPRLRDSLLGRSG